MLDDLLSGFEISVTVPVAWGDMDAFQHVNNTRFFRWFEDARIAYFERTGITAAEGRPTGVGPILASTTCRFKAPLSYPDEVIVGARVVAVGQTSFRMEYRVVSVAYHRVVAEGGAIVVAFDYDNEKKVRIPDAWHKALENVEGCAFPRDDAEGNGA